MPPIFTVQGLQQALIPDKLVRFITEFQIPFVQSLSFIVTGLVITHPSKAALLTHSAQTVQTIQTARMTVLPTLTAHAIQTASPIASAAGRSLAFIDNKPVSLAELAPLLLEAAGGQALLEITLDRRLEARVAQARITIEPAAIEAERQSLTRTMAAASDNDTAAVVLERIKAQRGLGERRFAALLRRNAMLRTLVKETIILSEEILTQTHQALFGPQVTIRIITVATQQEATAAATSLKAAPVANLEHAFTELAMTTSTDSSSGLGGLIPAFALADPNMPLPMRSAAAGTPPGTLSAVFQLDNGYGLMLVKSRTDGDGSSLQSKRAEVMAAARSRQERLAMERLARLIGSEPGVMITDGSLQWSVKSGGFELRP